MNTEPRSEARMILTNCMAETDLTDAEIAAIIRTVAADGVTPRLHAVAASAVCRMRHNHEGDCAGWVASLDDGEAAPERTCWLRWNGARRTLDWLADCPVIGCLLYPDHPGKHMPLSDGGNAPEARTA